MNWVQKSNNKLSIIVIMSKNTIYYSNKCQHSKELITIINKNGNRNNYSYICVDNSPVPPFIKSVPTLLISENNNNKILVGEEIFTVIGTNSNKTSTQMDGNPEAWHSNEMGSAYSDMYSFIEDNSSISHSFSFLNGNPNSIANTQNGGGNPTGSNNEHKDKLSQDMETLMQQRDSDMPNVIQRI